MLKVVERATGRVVAEYWESNVRGYTKAEDIQKLRELDGTPYFIIELKGMKASQAWWEAKKYDLVSNRETVKWKVGWCDNGKWKYIVVDSKSEMLAEVADKTTLSDKVSVREIRRLELERR